MSNDVTTEPRGCCKYLAAKKYLVMVLFHTCLRSLTDMITQRQGKEFLWSHNTYRKGGEKNNEDCITVHKSGYSENIIKPSIINFNWEHRVTLF